MSVMSNEMNKKRAFRYATGACFVLLAVVYLKSAYKWITYYIADGNKMFTIPTILFVLLAVSCGLLAASLFAAKPLLGAVGAALGLLVNIAYLVGSCLHYLHSAGFYAHPVLSLIVPCLLSCIYCMLLMAAALSKRRKVLFGILAAFCALGYLTTFFLPGVFLPIFAWTSFAFRSVDSPSAFTWARSLFRSAGAILCGFAYSNMPKRGRMSVPAVKPASPVGDRVAQLEKLQILLQQGIITQEEFNAKKQHLLDS